jgi:hypothetical protein
MNICLTFASNVPVQDVAMHEAHLRALCAIHKRDDPRILLLMPNPDRCRAVRAAIKELQAQNALARVEGECKPARTAALVLVKFAESQSPEMIGSLVKPNWLNTCSAFTKGETPHDFRLLPTLLEKPQLLGLLADLQEQGVLTFAETPVCAICLADEKRVDHLVSTGDISICNVCIAAGRDGRDSIRMPESPPTYPLLFKCDFCGAGLRDVESMMIGDEANICDGCLRACEATLKEGQSDAP